MKIDSVVHGIGMRPLGSFCFFQPGGTGRISNPGSSFMVLEISKQKSRHPGGQRPLSLCYANIFNLRGIIPVSYTHLDVYKRQVHRPGGEAPFF